MRVLLTGGSGFLGSALALHLIKAGHEVALLLRPSSRLDRLAGQQASFDIARVETDADTEVFVKRVQPNVVIHTACIYGRLGETPLDLFDVNQRLGMLIMQSLERYELPASFVNTGSALTPDVSPYALSKHQFSEWGRLLASQSTGTLQFINIRLQHMYGPGDDASKFTTHVLRACQRNEPELKLTAGEQLRDFIYIEDVVSAYDTLLECHDQLGRAVDIDVGSGEAPSLKHFVETVHRLTASETKLLFGALPYRANEAMHCMANVGQIKDLGWQPKFDLTAGILKTIKLENTE